MGLVLQLLGAIQLAVGSLILLGGAMFGGSAFPEIDSVFGGVTGIMLVGVFTGAFTMTLAGLVTIAVGSIYNGMKRLERQFASVYRDNDL